ncbi:hypothetical protein DRQ05_02975, partial [bacterium]
MFLTQEKALKKIRQDKEKGDIVKARKRALDALKRWPDDFEIVREAVVSCIETGDNSQAASILKSALRKIPSKRKGIVELAKDAYYNSANPIIGSFLVELMVRTRNIDEISELLRRSHESFIKELIKRSETRSEGLRKEAQTTAAAESDLLLGLLYLEDNQHARAVEPLGRVLSSSTVEPEIVGNLLIKIEQQLPQDSRTKYLLGVVSLKLSHYDKAARRFFQCLELRDPPMDELLDSIDHIDENTDGYKLLKGEAIFRAGRFEEGAKLIREYTEESASAPSASFEEAVGPDPFGEQAENNHDKFLAQRLSLLVDAFPQSSEGAFLYADFLKKHGMMKEAVGVLSNLYENNESSIDELISWLDQDDEVLLTAPSKKLLAVLHLKKNDVEGALKAARIASDIDHSTIPELISMTRAKIEEGNDSPLLDVLLAELLSKAKDREGAEEILEKLKRENRIDKEELYRLTREVIKNCGTSANGVISAIELGFYNGEPTEALPYLIAIYRESPEEHENIAQRIRETAQSNDSYWKHVGKLLDEMSKEETLSFPFKFLHALAHLNTGEVERAIFEFDQLVMVNSDIGYELMEIYKNAVERSDDNPTLHLALYHLDLDSELYVDAAHHLCRTLELDPAQIRDIVPMFEKLVEMDKGNHLIWEEMLKSALRLNHTRLAQEVLKKAIASLPKEDSAALHIYGAEISLASGNIEDALKCFAVALTSQKTNLMSVGDKLYRLIEQSPNNPQAYFLLGETLLRLGEEEKSVDAFRRCTTLSASYMKTVAEKLEQLLPLSAKPYIISGALGEIYWKMRDRERGYRYLRDAQKGPNDYIHSLSEILAGLLGDGDEDSTESDVKSTERNDKDPLHLLYARNVILEERFEEAVEILERLWPNGEAPEAIIASLREISSKSPYQPEANRLLARIFIDSNNVENALEYAVNMISDTSNDIEKLDIMAGEFFELYRNESAFLIRYAALKGALHDETEALRYFYEALSLNNDAWEEILKEISSASWSKESSYAVKILRVDSLLAGGRAAEAFDEIKGIQTSNENAEEVAEKLTRIIELEKNREMITHTAKLLVENFGPARAVDFVNTHMEGLSDGESKETKIEFAEMLFGCGFPKEARDIFDKLLAAETDKNSILKHIERAYEDWAEARISEALERLQEGSVGEEEAEKAVEICIDRNRYDDAISI